MVNLLYKQENSAARESQAIKAHPILKSIPRSLSPVDPKVRVATQTRAAKGQKWVAPRRSKPEFYIFNATAACL